MAHRKKVTCKKKKEFLEQLVEDGNVSRSCDAVGITKQSAYRHRKAEPEFAEAWGKAVEVGDLNLIDEARKRAMAGSDVLLMFMIKGKHPEFRDRLIDVPADSMFALTINIGTPEPKQVTPIAIEQAPDE